jgi:hypothetical protein
MLFAMKSENGGEEYQKIMEMLLITAFQHKVQFQTSLGLDN